MQRNQQVQILFCKSERRIFSSIRFGDVFTFVRDQHALEIGRSRDRRAGLLLETFLLGARERNVQTRRTKNRFYFEKFGDRRTDFRQSRTPAVHLL